MTLSPTGRVQLQLLLHGVRVPAEGGRQTPGGINLLLPDGVWVRAAVRSETPYALEWTAEGIHLVSDDAAEPIPVTVPALGEFYAQTTTSGRRFGDLGLIHGRYLVLPSSAPDQYWPRLTARLVGDVAPLAMATVPYSFGDALEVVEAGFRAGHMDFVHLEAPPTGAADGGIAALLPVIGAIKGHFDTLISVAAFAPETDSWIDAAYASGIDAISFGLGCYAPEAFADRASPTVKQRERDRILHALRYAAERLPDGCTCADLVVGVEPEAEARAAVEALAEFNVVPGLLFPEPGSNAGPDSGVASALWAHAVDQVRARPDLRAPWMRHFHATAHALDGPQMPLGRERLFGVSFAKLRRMLRVHSVNESYGSSGL